MKTLFKPLPLMLSASLIALGACTPQDPTLDLDRVLGVASDSFNSFEANSANTNVTEDNVMDTFAEDYAAKLNSSQPLVHPTGPVGVQAQDDGSFAGFHDANNNQTKDQGEEDLFSLEVDTENQRLLASDQEATHEQPYSGSGMNGFFMGMLLGNMLSRQRVSGVRPAAKTAKPRSRSSFKSARSRAGSGSHTSGK